MAIMAPLHVCHLVTDVWVGRLAVIVVCRAVHLGKLRFPRCNVRSIRRGSADKFIRVNSIAKPDEGGARSCSAVPGKPSFEPRPGDHSRRSEKYEISGPDLRDFLAVPRSLST